MFFDLDDPIAHTLRLPYVGWKFWMPAWIAMLAASGLTVIIVAVALKNWGSALWIGLPLAFGIPLGYTGRFRIGGYLIAVLTGVACVALTLASLSLAGAFCGLSLAVILFGPIVLGSLVGWVLRRTLRTTSFSQRDYLALLGAFAIPIGWAMLEGPGRYGSVERCSTQQVIAAPVNAVWRSVVFLEDVRRRPPLILRIGLAHPLYTIGQAKAPGDQRVCVYNRGRIAKQVSEIREGQLLAFDVVEQSIGYEHDVRLVSGSFELESLDNNTTVVTLTTSYQPRLTPRFVWRPFEQLAVRTLHRHVLSEMGERARTVGGDVDANHNR